MKVDLVALMNGTLQLELITETDVEYRLLERVWEDKKDTEKSFVRGYGNTVAPNGGATGFYVDLCRLEKINDV
jgi:hypothetical protein